MCSSSKVKLYQVKTKSSLFKSVFFFFFFFLQIYNYLFENKEGWTFLKNKKATHPGEGGLSSGGCQHKHWLGWPSGRLRWQASLN
jgi:hypothetical protein